MKRVFLMTLLTVFSSLSSAKTFQCKHVFSPTMDEVVSFDSSEPLLQKTVTFLNPDGSLEAKETKVFFSATEACGADLDFQKVCSKRSEDTTDGYRFSFSCGDGSISGHLLMYPNGYGVFSCAGQVGTQFFDCE